MPHSEEQDVPYRALPNSQNFSFVIFMKYYAKSVCAAQLIELGVLSNNVQVSSVATTFE